ncbi:MAG: hypothetical protein EOO88_24605 [Pedobacter sp.]|nr:MAG: hypothetical protein EOO88_24605 [Pedobacter sp.]
MNYELYYFDQMLEILSSTPGDSEVSTDDETEMSGEVLRIKMSIDAFVPNKQQPRKKFIHYQLSCIDRFRKKARDINQKAVAKSNTALIDDMIKAMDELISHIYRYYPGEFNTNTLATHDLLVKYQTNYEAKEQQCLAMLEEKKIAEIIKQLLKDIFKDSRQYGTYFYQVEFREALLERLPACLVHPHPNHQISMLLIAMRYNDLRLYVYQLEALSQRQQIALNTAEQFRELISYKKVIGQLMETEPAEYFHQRPNLKKMLLDAAETEIDFLKGLDFLNSELVNSGMLDSSYKVSLSVKQLAFFIYLNVECGVITERKAKTVHQYIISHASTKEAEHISEKSFSNGFYVHHPEDIRKVSEILGKMLALAQKLY